MIDAPRQTLTIVLGGQSLHLEVWWQPLSGKWYLSVADLMDAPIALGRQVAPLVRLVRSTVFAGEIVAIPRRAEDQGDIGRQGWQATHDLTYLTVGETALVTWP